MNRASKHLWMLAAVSAGLTAGCDGGGEERTSRSEPATDFISDNPNVDGAQLGGVDDGGDMVAAATGGGEGDGDGEGSGGGSGGGDPPPSAPEPEDPERTIAEADIIQIHDGRLYALSRFSGLSIIDVSGDRLELLGRKPLGGQPFEMYFVDGVIYAMFSEWGHYVAHADGSGEWLTTSHLEALDVSRPDAIETVGSFELPGSIADSRMVGDVIYTVTFEDGYCWECDADSPETTVTSLAVGDPGDIALVDRLTLEEPDANAYGWNRSIFVNEDRMYIGGVDWWNGDGDESSIRVVDISDPGGDLRQGTTVQVDGQIQSRWQMDEHEGVLRVISQPWSTSVNPSIQTFTVTSPDEITALGRGEIELPTNESLRAARFDGDRAYAITAVQTDPLYTIDLSDPANPRQVAALELPGFIYHIEPRGDRLLTLGFDQAAVDGALHVSLYDVSDLEAPTEIRRINFGADAAWFGEDQDRIHKLFKIDAERELVMVPYTGWSWDEGGCGSYESGVQLIDWKDDDLVQRGVAPIRGDARRAFIEGERLFALSDEQIRTFDFSDRDAPVKTAELQLATHVSRVAVGDAFVARLAADWWTSEPRVDIVDKSTPDAAEAIGSVGLGDMLASAEQDETCYGWGYWDTRIFTHGTDVYLVWPSWNGQVARLAVIDASDPKAPRVASHIDLPVDVYSYYGGWGWGGSDLVADGEPVVQLGSTLAFLDIELPTDEYGYPVYGAPEPGETHPATLRVVDLADAYHPVVASSVALPAGAGYTKLVASGDEVLLSHWEPLAEDPTLARFYLDRVDVSSPSTATLLPKVNVPGSLVALDAESQNVLTVDYISERHEHVTRAACEELFGPMATWTEDRWASTRGLCKLRHRRLRLTNLDSERGTATLLDEQRLPDRVWFDRLHVGDNRVFTTSQDYGTYGVDGVYEEPESLVWAIGGIREGRIAVVTKSLFEVWWASPLEARGQRLVATVWPGSIVSVDATDLDAITMKKHGDLPWYIESVSLDAAGDQALCSLGPYGLSIVDLD